MDNRGVFHIINELSMLHEPYAVLKPHLGALGPHLGALGLCGVSPKVAFRCFGYMWVELVST